MSHRLAIAIAATMLAAAFGAAPARAVTFAVDSELDGGDTIPGNGGCNASIEGPPLCTLRAAVEESNALAGPDRITVPAGDYHLTQSTALNITSVLDIIGASARTVTVRQLGDIDTGEGTDRVFNVTPSGQALLRRLTITNGRADSRNNHFGGNIRNNQGALTLDEVAVVGGEANSGGGVANLAGDLTITQSTFSGNQAPAEVDAGGDAGAILNVGNAKVPATLQIDTSTVSGNDARLVGGIFSYGHTDNKVVVTNSTIAFNTSGDRGGGGGVGINDGTATFENTIVSNNASRIDVTHPNCSVAATAALGSLGHNLEDATDCGFKATGDIQGVDPFLGKLSDNGGQTDTHALSADSKALDAANDATCLAADQRGFFRPQGPACDIGAYERDQPPETTLNGPSGRINDTTPTYTFSSNEPGSTKTPFECLLDAATDWIACNSPITLGPFAEGTSHTLRVRAIDLTNNVDPTPATRSFTIDTTAPGAPSITSSTPASPANDNAPELKGTAEAGSTVRLYTTADCTGAVAASGTAATFAGTGLTVNVANNTTTNFRATATDAAGNISTCSAAFTYVEDSTPPAAPSITSSTPASPANDNAPELKGTAAAGSTVRIYTTTDCTGAVAATGTAAAFANPGLTVNVANNTTTNFRATATDAAGNTSTCSAPFTYVEDSTGPTAPTITGGPDGPTNDTTPTFSFTSSEGTATFQCRVAPQPFAPCTSPHTTEALTDGPQTFIVRAVDLAGNPGTATTRDFSVETGAPDTSISDGPAGPINDSTPTFTFGSDDPAATFQCRFDADAFADCTSPHTPAVALGDGAHTFEVQAKDTAGNLDTSPATRAFSVDTRPPETSIGSGPPALTTDSTPTFEFSSDEPGSTFQCSLDAGAFAACSSPFTTAPLGPGAHTFVVRAIDPSGNIDPSPALGIDTTAAQKEFTLLGGNPGTPVLGDNFNLEAVSGDIFVSVPANAAVARARSAQAPPGYQSPIKGRVFVPLEEIRQLPIGSFVDARFGTSRMTTARNRRGRTQSGNFSAGVFQVLQSRARRAGGLTELRLKGGSFNGCRAGGSVSSDSATAAGLSRRSIRRLRSSATGRFRTRGRNSSATVRGTIWTVTDRCDGTLTTVKRGKVAVRDFRRKKTVLVRTGKSYLARAQR